MDGAAVIQVSGLVKRFGDFTAVDDLELRVGRGAVHGFLGPNGAGKSTTIRVLLGLYRASAGRIRVFGLDPGRQAAQINRRVSYVPGEVNLWPNLTGQEVLDALAGLRGSRDRVAERRLVDAFALDPRKLVRTYSKGNRQKVILIAALAAPTELLVLDEPTSGLDPLMEELFQHCVREASAAGRTVLLSSHILAEVEDLCESVTIVKDGRLVESGRLADLRHMAAAQITAQVPADGIAAAEAGLRSLGLADQLDTGNGLASGAGREAGRSLRLSVPRQQVSAVLRVLIDCDARELTCTPARLEDLFLRHYEVAAR
jgi:ABC-2 type transport system ATP-binding protein